MTSAGDVYTKLGIRPIINAQGKVSPRTGSKFHLLQYELLAGEGIVFAENRIDLDQFRWCPEEEE